MPCPAAHPRMGHIRELPLGLELWCHGGHIGVPKQWNSGHVGVPNWSSGSWTLFKCKHFLLFNLHRCWPREWKRSIRLIKFNSASVLQWFPLSTLMKSINYWPRVLVSFAVLPRRLPSAWASCLNPWTGFLKSVFVVLVFFPSLYPFGHFCWGDFPYLSRFSPF